MEIASLSNLFKAIGDPVRLRLLHLLCAEELTVGELVRILELPQSTVSRHIKTLRERGLVADRPVGAATFYRAAIEAEGANGDTPIRDSLVSLLRGSNLSPTDRRRLDRILVLRASEGKNFFDEVGLRWDALREDCFGPAFHLEAFSHLLPREWTVTDLGTGTGYLLPTLGSHFRRVIGVDMSEPMIELARQNLAGGDFKHVELRHGPLEKLPIETGEVDLAVALLMLHHLANIEAGLREIHRILKPGGRLLLVEIHPYENERFRVAMGDRRAGVDAEEMMAKLREAGFGMVEMWDLAYLERPEHELAPLPRLYEIICEKK